MLAGNVARAALLLLDAGLAFAALLLIRWLILPIAALRLLLRAFTATLLSHIAALLLGLLRGRRLVLLVLLSLAARAALLLTR